MTSDGHAGEAAASDPLAGGRWTELPTDRIEDEPWWLVYVPDPSPERIAAHAELATRAGYDVHPQSSATPHPIPTQ